MERRERSFGIAAGIGTICAEQQENLRGGNEGDRHN